MNYRRTAARLPLILTAVTLAFTTLMLARAADAQVYISEVYANAAGNDPTELSEFVELYNAGATAADLTSHGVSDNAAAGLPGANDAIAIFPSGTSLPVGGIVVVTRRITDFLAAFPAFRTSATVLLFEMVDSDGNAANDMTPVVAGVSTDLVLENAGDEANYFVLSGLSATALDSITWGTGTTAADRPNVFAAAAPEGQSFERNPANRDTNTALDFQLRTPPTPGSVSTTGLPRSTVCLSDATCGSGHCVDGVCCDTACNGQCEACDVGGSVGTCSPVTAGTAPHGSRLSCNGSGSACGGTCGGTNRNACTYPGATASCRAASCTAGITTAAASCDGAGNCPMPVNTACAPYTCDATNTACRSSCTLVTAVTDCVAGGTCASGMCNLPTTGTLTSGTICMTGLQCASGLCVDGVCCNSACGGTCEACNVPTALGVCTPVPDGAPDNRCGGVGVCAGVCNGARACRFPMAGTACSATSCTSGAFTPAGRCSTGSTNCNTSSAAPCPGNFACSTPLACGSACTLSSQCATGFMCDMGVCSPRSTAGAACTIDAQCSSGHCTDGVCCESACNGQCEQCNAPGREGMCVAVTGSVVGLRAACTGAGTTCGGVCSGANRTACQYPANTTVCAPGTCAASTSTPAALCNGAGVCSLPGAPMSCAPYTCSGTACRTMCTVPGDCAVGAMCMGGMCVPVVSVDGGVDVVISEGGTDSGTDVTLPDAGGMDATIGIDVVVPMDVVVATDVVVPTDVVVADVLRDVTGPDVVVATDAGTDVVAPDVVAPDVVVADVVVADVVAPDVVAPDVVVADVVVADAGGDGAIVMPDGAIVMPDGAIVTDTGTGSDTGTTVDSGSNGVERPRLIGGSCACRAGTGSTDPRGAAWIGLALAAVVVRRRRRASKRNEDRSSPARL